MILRFYNVSIFVCLYQICRFLSFVSLLLPVCPFVSFRVFVYLFVYLFRWYSLHLTQWKESFNFLGRLHSLLFRGKDTFLKLRSLHNFTDFILILVSMFDYTFLFRSHYNYSLFKLDLRLLYLTRILLLSIIVFQIMFYFLIISTHKYM